MIAAAINLMDRPWNGLTGSAGSAPSVPSGNGFLTNLLAYLKLDETTEAYRYDSSVNGNNFNAGIGGSNYNTGIINNGFYNSGEVPYAHAYHTSLAATLAGSSVFSVSYWVQRYGTDDTKEGPAVDIGDSIIHHGASDGGQFIEYSTVGGGAQYYYFGGDSHLMNHFVLVVTPLSGMDVYLNGVMQDPAYFDGGLYWDNTSIGITDSYAYPSVIYPFVGVVDEFGIWTKALTQADVTALYNSGAGKAFSTFTT